MCVPSNQSETSIIVSVVLVYYRVPEKLGDQENSVCFSGRNDTWVSSCAWTGTG